MYKVPKESNRDKKHSVLCIFDKEWYPSGSRGAPAKGVDRESGARVQIPPTPPQCFCTCKSVLYIDYGQL